MLTSLPSTTTALGVAMVLVVVALVGWALQLMEAANQRKDFSLMLAGCMVSSSLSIAPHLWVAALADACDLDGPWWLAKDRPGGCRIDDGVIYAPTPGFWGG